MKKQIEVSLNPCFSGRWSLTGYVIIAENENDEKVLILVLVEDGL